MYVCMYIYIYINIIHVCIYIYIYIYIYVIHVCSDDFRRQSTSSESGATWPPYASCLIFEVLRHNRLRVLYQFEPLTQVSVVN